MRRRRLICQKIHHLDALRGHICRIKPKDPGGNLNYLRYMKIWFVNTGKWSIFWYENVRMFWTREKLSFASKVTFPTSYLHRSGPNWCNLVQRIQISPKSNARNLWFLCFKFDYVSFQTSVLFMSSRFLRIPRVSLFKTLFSVVYIQVSLTSFAVGFYEKMSA